MNQDYQTLCLQSISLYLHDFFFHWCVCPVQWIALLHGWYVYRLIFATYVSYLKWFHEISVMNVCDTSMVWNRNRDRRRGRGKIFKVWNQLIWDEKGKKGRKGLQEKKMSKTKFWGSDFYFFAKKDFIQSDAILSRSCCRGEEAQSIRSQLWWLCKVAEKKGREKWWQTKSQNHVRKL